MAAAAAENELAFSRIHTLQLSYFTSAEIERLSVCVIDQTASSDALGHAVRENISDFFFFFFFFSHSG